MSDISSYCECSGEFKCTKPWGPLRDRLHVFGNIGQFYNMELLGSVVRGLLAQEHVE